MHSKKGEVFVVAKIGILTQHLLNNYGGLLQNFALQQCLKKIGHEVKTIDYLRTMNCIPLDRCLLSWAKTLLLFFIPGKRRRFVRCSYKGFRPCWADEFVSKWINTTSKCYKYKASMLGNFDIVIVGSDQVWRPKYNYRIQDMFLEFARNLPIKRIAYAASFGVDEWEYTLRQTKVCSALAKKFNAISVREETGVNLCKEHLGVDATWVLDPTLLLDKEDYCEVCKDVPIIKDRFLAAYVLDKNEAVRVQCESIAAERNLSLKFFEASTNASLSVSEWLAMFRDAAYVVTDSFHGTVFSIIFGKEFKCLYNESRGSARFDSLLKLYDSGKFDEMRDLSINWLKKNLETI